MNEDLLWGSGLTFLMNKNKVLQKKVMDSRSETIWLLINWLYLPVSKERAAAGALTKVISI
jgi:hypothetical protein